MSTGDLGPGYGTAFHPEPDLLRGGHDGPAGPVALRSLPRRRRPVMIFLAVALVGAGIVASAALYQRANHQVPVLVITAPVAAGEKITSSDVGISSIAAGPGITSIPGGQLNQVVGRVAAIPLRPGTLLTPADLTTTVPPGPGQQLVPLAVRPSSLPASGLSPGDQVVIIATPGNQGQSAGSTGFVPVLTRPVAGVVERVSTTPDEDGFDVVDLLVPASSAAQVGEQASTGLFALLVTKRAA